MAKPNEIAFSIEDYDGNETEMFAAIGKTLKILTKNGYICTFSCDEPAFQTYVIEFDYEDEELATVKPYWLTPKQYEKLQDLEAEETEEDWHRDEWRDEGDEDDGTDAG